MKTMKDTSVLKEFAKYVSANVIAMIGLSCYILADTFFISLKLGQTGLAALNLSSPSFNIVFSIGMMIAVGGGTRFAILKGSKSDDEANKVFTHSMLIVALFAMIFVFLGIFASRPIAQLLGAEGDTLEYSNTYVQIILCFAPFFMFSNMFQNFIRNDGAPRLAMIASLSGNLFNIVFDYVLLFPCNLDMLGAALATGFSPIVSILILSLHFLRKKNTFHLKKTKLSIRTYGRICSLGLAPFISEISFAAVLTVFNGLFKKLGGDTAIAAFTIVINVFYVTNSIFNGVANGTQPMISFSYGESDHKKIRQILKYALVTVSSIAVLLYVAIFFGADGIASVFNTQGVEALQQASASKNYTAKSQRKTSVFPTSIRRICKWKAPTPCTNSASRCSKTCRRVSGDTTTGKISNPPQRIRSTTPSSRGCISDIVELQKINYEESNDRNLNPHTDNRFGCRCACVRHRIGERSYRR